MYNTVKLYRKCINTICDLPREIKIKHNNLQVKYLYLFLKCKFVYWNFLKIKDTKLHTCEENIT